MCLHFSNMGQIRPGKYTKKYRCSCMNRFWGKFVQQWYAKTGTFIPYRLGHTENMLWTFVNGLFIFWTCSSFAMLLTTRFVLSSTRLVLGRAPALQPRPMVLCQAPSSTIVKATRPGFDPYPRSMNNSPTSDPFN